MQGGGLHEEGLEPREHLASHYLEAAFGFVGGVERVGGVGQGLDAGEAFRTGEACRVKAEALEVVLGCFDSLEE